MQRLAKDYNEVRKKEKRCGKISENNFTSESTSKQWQKKIFVVPSLLYGNISTYLFCDDTGKSLSEALIFASTNPQYDGRLFIVHENCKLRSENTCRTCCVYKLFFFCFFLTFRTILVHNMFYPCLSLEFSCIKLVIQ